MNPRVKHGTSGYLLLLLTLLIPHFLEPALTPSMPSESANEGQLFIQVEGDVNSPAVYAFNTPPNLEQLINRAGGLCSDGILQEKFQDLVFSSGMKVAIRFREEKSLLYQSRALRAEASRRALASGGVRVVKASEMSAFYKTTLGISIYLNSESEMGLTAIPGIGRGLAKAIVEERTKRGGFKSLKELLSVNGIGEKLYRKITPYLTIKEKDPSATPHLTNVTAPLYQFTPR
jgi:competence protein ComEA